jgi:hypothetical protein
MMPSLFWNRYEQRVWTREEVSLAMARGVVVESRLAGMTFQVLASRMATTAEGWVC